MFWDVEGLRPCDPASVPGAALCSGRGLTPASSALSRLRISLLPPSPRPPSPAGKGEPFVIFARGFAPCIPATAPGAARLRGACPATPRPNPRGTGSPDGLRRFFGVPAPCHLRFAPTSRKPSAPSPRPALAERSSHAGEGGDFCYLCKGLRPRLPCLSGSLPRFSRPAGRRPARPGYRNQYRSRAGGTGCPSPAGSRGRSPHPHTPQSGSRPAVFRRSP